MVEIVAHDFSTFGSMNKVDKLFGPVGTQRA